MYIEDKLNQNNMNAFIYSINDNMLHCYHQKLVNEGEVAFYSIRRNNDFDNFVRASVPTDLEVSLFIIIDTKDKIDKIVNEVSASRYTDIVDLVVYKFDEIEGDYWYLKINSHLARKENMIERIKSEGNFNKVVVCGSGRTDIPLIKAADFSICLDRAPDYIKDEVNTVIDSNSENVLKIFEKIYHSRNVNRTINKIKKKYIK